MCTLELKGLGWRDGQTELQKAVEGLHQTRWSYIEPRTAGDERFKVPEQERAFILI
jgi:hypothetical protein